MQQWAVSTMDNTGTPHVSTGHEGAASDLPDDLMRVSEAARICGISRSTVAAWAARGRLRKWKRGVGTLLVSLADVRELARIREV